MSNMCTIGSIKTVKYWGVGWGPLMFKNRTCPPAPIPSHTSRSQCISFLMLRMCSFSHALGIRISVSSLFLYFHIYVSKLVTVSKYLAHHSLHYNSNNNQTSLIPAFSLIRVNPHIHTSCFSLYHSIDNISIFIF